MTTIHIYDPGDPDPAPDLPPLPIGALAVGTCDLLQQAADLPQPVYIALHCQRADLQFPPGRASLRAITRWALRFGAVVLTTPYQDGETGPQTLCRAEFDYYGIAVLAYAFIPAGPPGAAAPAPGPGQDPIPHTDYPHEPGRLHDCPACQVRCHCTPGDAECVYDGPHNGLAAP